MAPRLGIQLCDIRAADARGLSGKEARVLKGRLGYPAAPWRCHHAFNSPQIVAGNAGLGGDQVSTHQVMWWPEEKQGRSSLLIKPTANYCEPFRMPLTNQPALQYHQITNNLGERATSSHYYCTLKRTMGGFALTFLAPTCPCRRGRKTNTGKNVT